MGASFDASSRIDSLFIGDVRHLFFAGIAGLLMPLAEGMDLQLLGEAGAHRVSGTRFGPVLVPSSLDPNASILSVYYGTNPGWAPFAGLRPSLEFVVDPI